MTTVAAMSQIPVTEAENTVLKGPSLERAMWSQHENAAWNWGAAQWQWLWTQQYVETEHWALQYHKVCVMLCDLQLVQEDA